MLNKRIAGAFTLIELLIVVSISGILMTLAVPSFHSLYQRTSARSSLHSLSQHISYARLQAVSRRQRVTLCGSRQGQACDGDWQHGLLVFVDNNGNGTLDRGEVPLRIAAFKPHQGQLSWRSFRGKDFLQFTPLGTTSAQNGTFTYRYHLHHKKHEMKLVIAKSGHVHLARKTV